MGLEIHPRAGREAWPPLIHRTSAREKADSSSESSGFRKQVGKDVDQMKPSESPSNPPRSEVQQVARTSTVPVEQTSQIASLSGYAPSNDGAECSSV